MANQIPTFKGSLVSTLIQKKDDNKKDNASVWSTAKVEEAMLYLSKGKKPPIGNPFFERKFGQRKANLVFEYTPQEIEELKKCKRDIFYFAEKYCMIKTDEGLYTHFNLRDYQKNALQVIQDKQKIVYMASRQIGKCSQPNIYIDLQNPNGEIKKFLFSDFFYDFIDKSFFDKIKKALWKIYSKLDFLKYIILILIQLIEYFEYKNYDESEKIVKTIKLPDGYKIKTDTGFKSISHIHQTKRFQKFRIQTNSGKWFEGADKHIFFDENMNEIFLDQLSIGSLIQTEDGLEKVTYIKSYSSRIGMYDVTVDDKNHRFYTNGILSHNTIMTSLTLLHYICFNVEKNVLLVANKGDTSKEVMNKMKEIYVRLPFFMQPGIENWAVNSVSFDNDCYIQAIATTSTPAIGFTIDFLYIDEFAHIPPNIATLFWKSVIPTMDAVKTSKMVITSTPNGMNLFYDVYTAAEKNLNGYTPIKTYWHEVPGRDDIWRDDKVAELGNGNMDLGFELFNQEYDLQFITDSILLIDNDTLNVLNSKQMYFKHQVIDELEDSSLDYSKLKWHPDFEELLKNKENMQFILSIDLGYGMLKDYSVINIFNITTLSNDEIMNMNNAKSEIDYLKLKQIGLYRSNDQEPKEVANIVMEIVKFLGIDNTLINFEVNAAGDYFYKCLEEDDEFFDDLVIQTSHSKIAKIQRPGVKTTNQKVNYCKELKTQLRYGQVEVYEWETIEELKVFGMNKDKTSYEAMKGHDDIVMSMVINMGIKQSFNYSEVLKDVLELYSKEQLDLIYEKLSFSENTEQIDYNQAFEYADQLINRLQYKSENPLSGFNNFSV